ncbi:MAG: MarR family transcriptional regulator, partial [Proteobacteria bacterium]|nr:MarR family transcriptional regulator [Pseudomonadota bacterium]
VDEGYSTQQAGKTDRRERLLTTTARGKELAGRLVRPQLERIARALEASGAESRFHVDNFLSEMINEADRAQVSQLLRAQRGARGASGEPT